MRIAIVGSGVSGLVCAHVLRPEHDVTVFEADERAGGHTHTVRVEGPLDGKPYDIDTGFIVFNDRTYPNFVRLLNQLGVASKPTSMSFSVRCDRTGVEYNGTSVNRLFAQRRNLLRPSFLRMVFDILRFGREAPAALAGGGDAVTVEEFVRAGRFSEAFLSRYLVPMGSALWSCPPGVFRAFPIRFVVEFMRNHSMLAVGGRPRWRVIEGGSSRYVERLTAGFADRIRTAAPVRRVRRTPGGVDVSHIGGSERFDHVILACHADQALEALADPSETERHLLSAFPYQANDVVLHTDTSVLPRGRRAWAAWNYRTGPVRDDRSTVTYNMNILQGIDAPQVFLVTLNDTAAIRPERILRRFRYAHPVFTTSRAEAQARHRDLVARNRTSFCGAYWGYGFHEDGVRSALAVCAAFGRHL